MKNLIKQIIKESIDKQNQIEKIKNIKLPSTIEGRFLNKQQAQDLQKEIEANYTDNLTQHFKKEKNDIRMHMFNYDQPIAEKNLNGINLRITTGLIRNKKITYLLYANGKIIGEFFSVDDIKRLVKYIELNLIPNKSLEKLNEDKITPTFVKDFLNDFGILISLNFSQVTRMGKDPNATKELEEMMKVIRKPIINGENYFNFITNNINSITNNPKLLSALLKQVRELLIYIEPRIEKFVKDEISKLPNGSQINFKEKWLDRINTLKENYKKIIANSQQNITEAIKDNKVICDNCGWSWNIKDGGKDKYVCHNILASGRMCKHDNTPKKKLKELFDYENEPNKYIGDVVKHDYKTSTHGDLVEHITIEKDNYIIKLNITIHGGLEIKFEYDGTTYLTNKNEQYKVANFIIENLKKYINEKNITSITFSISNSDSKRFPIYQYALNKLNFFLERNIDNYYFFKKNLKEQKDILNEKCWKGYTQKGMKTMFGKQYPNCVKKLKEDDDYKIQHKAPTKNYGATMDRLTDIYPDDIYSSKALQRYGEGYPYDRLAIQIMQSAKDNPNKKITIYRAVPKDVNTINSGDWVTTTMQYAKSHGKSVMDNDYKIISMSVDASTLHTDANSIHEFGYNA